jgi:O-antigen/teichoic acid export membrane protein
MKIRESAVYKFFSEIVETGTSQDRIKALARVPLYANALFLITASASSAVLGFVFWIAAARFYPAEQVGLASAAISGMGLVVTLSRFGFEMGLVRFLKQSGDNAVSTVNTVLTIGLLSSATASFIFVAGLGVWSPALGFIKESPLYAAGFVVFCSASMLSTFIDYTCIANRKAYMATSRSILFAVLKIPLAIALAGILKASGILVSWGTALTVAYGIAMIFFLPRALPGYRFRFTIKKEVLKDLLRFAFANYAASFLWGVPGMVFPIMVLNMLGAESSAYFYVAWAIGAVLTTVSNDTSTSLFAEGSYDEEQLHTNIKRSLKMVGVLLVPAVVLVLLLADKLLLLFGTSYSESATTLLRIVALAAIPMAVNNIYLGVKRVQKDLKALLGLSAFTAVVTLGAALMIVPKIGIQGTGISWLSGQSAAALMVLWNVLGRKKPH